MGGGSIGGGNGRSNVKNLKTYIGMDAGRTPGWLDQFMGMYGQNAQRNNALSDQLLGGQGYGASTLFRGNGAPAPGGGAPPPADDGGGGAEAPGSTASARAGGGTAAAGRQAAVMDNGAGNRPQEGDAGTGDENGTQAQADFVRTHPQVLEEGSQEGPNGGLIGTYQQMQENPWQTQGNDSETDNLGQYDWMASGRRNADESGVYGGLGDLGKEYGDFGQQNATDRFRKGGYTAMSSQDPNQWESGAQSTYGDLSSGDLNDLEGGATGIYGDIGGGPNKQESDLYGATGGFANQGSAGETGGLGVYQKMAAKPGYDDATKAAMTQEAMSTARSPFERARDRILRANTARGNPASSMGAEIALARDEGNSLTSAGRKNLIDQAQEEARQREVAGSGLLNAGQIANARRQAGLSMQAGQNAQQAQQRLAGASGLGSMSRDVTGRRMGAAAGTQSVGKDITSRAATGLAGMGDAQAAEDARKKAGLEGKSSTLAQQAAENTKQRNIALQGTQGKQDMFNTMWARKNAGTQGLAALQAGAAGQGQTSLAGGSNLGGKTREDYTEAGDASGGL